MRLTIKTDIVGDEIRQEIVPELSDGPGQTFGRQVMNLKEEAIRNALISLGWTPPSEPTLNRYRYKGVVEGYGHMEWTVLEVKGDYALYEAVECGFVTHWFAKKNMVML